MIAFETLLLGIVSGIWPIRLMVTPPVVTVELRLDAAVVGVMHSPPWAMECNLGSGPMPHELTAIGRDASGREVARATQWANLGRDRLRLSALLERDAATRRPAAVRLAWETADMVQPQAVTATLDGTPLEVVDPHRIGLPKVDSDRPHVVSAEVVLSPQLRDRADLAFGGDVVDRAESELTAVAVTVPSKRTRLELRDAQGLFSEGGRPMTPIGVDEGHAEVAVVADAGAAAVIAAHPRNWDGLAREARQRSLIDRQFDAEETALARGPVGIASDRFFIVGTAPSRLADSGRKRVFYPMSPPAPLAWLTRHSPAEWLERVVRPASQAIADTVAVAACEVAASNSRRAVVLILAESKGAEGVIADVSVSNVAAVKAYLAALHVPLTVWSLSGSSPGPQTSAWAPAVAVADCWEMQAQAEKLARALTMQRIVWFVGRYLPQRITLDESRTALRLAQ